MLAAFLSVLADSRTETIQQGMIFIIINGQTIYLARQIKEEP